MNNPNIYDLNLKVVYYARISTDRELQITSIINQANYFENYIKTIPKWTLIGKYIDEGISGKNTYNRINFKKMIQDGLNGKYDLILTKSVSRFARNTIDSIKYTDLLKEKGIGVYFINDNINTLSHDSEFRLTLMASIAQDEIRKLSESVKFGLRESINRGIVLGNNNILGYKKNKGRLIIDKKEAIIVKEIFNLFIINKYNYTDISKIINNKYNKKMDSTSIKRVLTNHKYKGFYCGKKSTIINYKKGNRVNYNKKDWIIYKDTSKVPPIIEEQVWNKANKIILEKNNLRHKSKYNIYCHKHKRRCKYIIKKYKKITYKYYTCPKCFSIKENIIDRITNSKEINKVLIEKHNDYLKIYIFFLS